MSLSLAVITYNEEDNIIRLLDSVSDMVDEIVVVDSYSSDRTKELCLKHPKVRFSEKKFNGYGEQKNHALDLCTMEWVLFLDADEVPDEALKHSIKAIIHNSKNESEIYYAKFTNHLGIYTLKFGGWGNVFRERLFKRCSARYSDDKVHEFLTYKGKAGILVGKINHYTYKSIHHHIVKINKYSDMMAEKMYDRGKRITQFKVIFSPVFEFTKVFIFKLGILDGFGGFYVAKTMSYYTFLKYSKLREKIRQDEIRKSLNKT